MDWFSLISNPDNWFKGLGLLGAGAGIGGNIWGALNNASQMDRMNKIIRQQMAGADQARALTTSTMLPIVNQLTTTANAPLDWQSLYNPVTSTESDAIRRAMIAEMANRGTPYDSQLVTSEVSRILGETSGQRVKDAQNAALSARQAQLSGLGTAASAAGGAGSLYAGAGPGYPPVMSSPAANLSPIMQWLQMMRTQQSPYSAPAPGTRAVAPTGAVSPSQSSIFDMSSNDFDLAGFGSKYDAGLTMGY